MKNWLNITLGFVLFGILSMPNLGTLGLTTAAIEAITEGAVLSLSGSYGLGVHIQNHSWVINQGWLDYYTAINQIEHPMALRDAINAAWQNNSIVVAARGNDGDAGQQYVYYPACYEDHKVLNVGASGTDGLRFHGANGDVNVNVETWASNHSFEMDFLAPGVTELVSAPYYENHVETYAWESSILQYQYPSGYSAFHATSAAAPHVTGVVALMLSRHNVTNGAPNNLATEDVEQILQKTAYRPQNNLFYDDFDAWGLINAGLAVQQVDYPNYFVKHYYNNNSFKTVTSLGQTTMTLPTGNQFNVQPGTYIANKLLVTWNFNITLDNNHEIIDFWPLMVKSHPGFLLDTDYADIIELLEFPEVTPTINGNNITFTVQSYAYMLLYDNDDPLNQVNIHLPYHPFGAEKMDYAFSLHVRLNEQLSIENSQEQTIMVYPNPSSDEITLSLGSIIPSQIQVIDASGRLVFTVDNFETSQSNTNNVVMNIGALQNGIYFLKVIDQNQLIHTTKILKK